MIISPNTRHFPGGSWTATTETVSTFLLSQMKTVTVNSAAATSVMTTMETILSTTVGTATEGSITMTGEEYLEAITIFVQLLETDMSSSSIVTQSLSLTSVATTLTAAQVLRKENSTLIKIFTGDINYLGENQPYNSHQSNQSDSYKPSRGVQRADRLRSNNNPNHLRI